MKVPGFDDLGKEMKDLLNGKKAGIFQYNQKLSVNLKAANGVVIEAKATRKTGQSLDTDFKGKWTNGFVTVEAMPMAPKASVKVQKVLAPGLLVTLSDEFPNPLKKAKATIEYNQPHITSKFIVGLNSSPSVEAAASIGYNGFVAGGKAFLDVRGSKCSAYSMGCAYMGPNFVATGHVTEGFGKITGTYWQKVDMMSSVAAEVVHTPANSDIALTMGYSHTEADGTLNKVKISNKGLLQIHRDMKLNRDTTVGISCSFNALDTTQQPDIGFSMDFSP